MTKKTFYKNQTLQKFFILLLLSTSAFQASSAEFASPANSLKSPHVAPVGMGELTQVGQSSARLQPLKGFADDLPLLVVIKQITPHGWVVRKSDTDGLDLQMNVSWQGGASWVETLQGIVNRYPVNASVNWDKKELTLASPVSKAMVFEVESSRSLKVAELQSEGKEKNKDANKDISKETTKYLNKDRDAMAPPASQPYVAIVPRMQSNVINASAPVRSWSLNARLSLKENVASWAAQSGYRVVWLGEDYPLDDSRTLVGEFAHESGPIAQLALDYGPQSRVQSPLSFQFFQNMTLVVENWKFEQSGYPQYGTKP